jgi:putative hydrolase of the HAD superfamily
MLKTVIFDFDQTLVNSADGFRAAEKWLQHELYRALGLTDWEDFIAVYRRIRGGAGAGESPAAKLRQWHAVAAHFGGTLAAATGRAWQNGYWERVESGTQPLPGALAVLDALRPRCKLGLLTNAAAAGDRALRSDSFPELLARFEAVIVCGEDGIPLKPHPDGFHAILGALGVSAAQAVFVGDNWETDIRGALGVGILPVWLRHAAIRRKPPAAVPEGSILLDRFEPLAALQPTDTHASIRLKLCAAAAAVAG